MHIYAFGSICRGEIDLGSDVDLLACVNGPATEIDREKYSVYQYANLKSLWEKGNPFAWHLHIESKMIFSPDGSDFIASLGEPEPYRSVASDLQKFQRLFEDSYQALQVSERSYVFHLSCVFLAIRNFATCHSLAIGKPVFSRRSPLLIDCALGINATVFSTLVRARILSTRGLGRAILGDEAVRAVAELKVIPDWMCEIWSQHRND